MFIIQIFKEETVFYNTLTESESLTYFCVYKESNQIQTSKLIHQTQINIYTNILEEKHRKLDKDQNKQPVQSVQIWLNTRNHIGVSIFLKFGGTLGRVPSLL